MAYTRGRCTNLDYCSLAGGRRDIEVLVGEDFVCPECGKPLKAPPVQASTGGGLVLPLLIGGGVVVLICGAVFLGMRMGGSPSTQTAQVAKPATAPAASAQTAALRAAGPAESVLVRLAGSDGIATTLAPSLAAAYLAQIGDTDVKTEPGPAGQFKIVGTRGDRREAILVTSSSAAAGFTQLGAGTADVVMAARRILPNERDSLTSLGDLSSPAAEHLVALDGIAIVVNPGNSVTTLRRDQLRGIFTGAIKDWSELGGTPGPITIYARPANSEAAQIFDTSALGGAPVAASAKILQADAQISQAVTSDPHGIGAVSLPNIQQAHALSIGETGSAPVSPTNKLAIATDDYPLSERLYFYSAPSAKSGIAQKFVEFAAGPGGQAIVDQQGLVQPGMKAAAAAAAAAPATPIDRLKQIVGPAKKLAVDFRFNPNSSDLDMKGQRDIDRVTNYILSNHNTGSNLILVGFADNQGDPAANIAVSKKRADALAAMFAKRGLPPAKVVGFGSDLPLADNSTEDGRQKNRRVEIYILP